jgi:hypothetical protein
MEQPSIVERAFALAKSGECEGVGDIRRRLKEEQFGSVEAHLAGRSIKRQLVELCSKARQGELESELP